MAATHFMIWWYWILLGLFLAAVELVTPGGFFFLFFGVAALVVGILELLNIIEADSLQWGLFSIVSLVCLAFFRKPLLERMHLGERPDVVDTLVGELAIAPAPIPAGEHGRAEVRGALWTVRNVDETAIAAGERCRVIAVRGLELDIRPERSR